MLLKAWSLQTSTHKQKVEAGGPDDATIMCLEVAFFYVPSLVKHKIHHQTIQIMRKLGQTNKLVLNLTSWGYAHPVRHLASWGGAHPVRQMENWKILTWLP